MRAASPPTSASEPGAPPADRHRARLNRRMTIDSTTTDLLTEHHLGDVPVVAADGRATTVHLGRVSASGGFDEPGEFDVPPIEPVVLIGEIPWELREAE
jgi:hypothetical protein